MHHAAARLALPAKRVLAAATRPLCIAYKANDEGLTSEAALASTYIDARRSDEIVDPRKMVATASPAAGRLGPKGY